MDPGMSVNTVTEPQAPEISSSPTYMPLNRRTSMSSVDNVTILCVTIMYKALSIVLLPFLLYAAQQNLYFYIPAAVVLVLFLIAVALSIPRWKKVCSCRKGNGDNQQWVRSTSIEHMVFLSRTSTTVRRSLGQGSNSTEEAVVLDAPRDSSSNIQLIKLQESPKKRQLVHPSDVTSVTVFNETDL